MTDTSNCGMCGTKCPGTQGCVAGACTCESCGNSPAGVCIAPAQCLSNALPTDCAQLHLLAPALPSGAYYVSPAGAPAAFQVYCDMTADGGGWTLALKADGTINTTCTPAAPCANSTPNQGWSYASDVWTTSTTNAPDYTFGTNVVDLSRVNAKYNSFNTMPYTQVRMGMTSSTDAAPAAPTFVQFSIPGATAYTTATAAGKVAQTSLQATFNAGTLIPVTRGGESPDPQGGSPTRAEWLSLVSASNLQPYCNVSGLNVDMDAGNTSWGRTRVGIIGNENGVNDCGSPDSFLGLGNNGTGAGTTVPVGNYCIDNINGGANGEATAFAWLYIRNNDFRTVVPAAASCAAHFAAGHTIPGIYSLKYGAAGVTTTTYCDMTHGGGGWTMAYKYTAATKATTIDPFTLWTQAAATNDAVPAATNVMSPADIPNFTYGGQPAGGATLTFTPAPVYVGALVTNNWATFAASQARVVVYNGEEEGAAMVFKIPAGSNTTAWFTNTNLTSSPWTDLTAALAPAPSAALSYFAIAGDTTTRRWLVENSAYGACGTDKGWLALTQAACPWDTQYGGTEVQILYSNQKTAQLWQAAAPNPDVSAASSFVVYVQ
jgi:hypothetical protein